MDALYPGKYIFTRAVPARVFKPSQLRVLTTATKIVPYAPKRSGLLLLNTGVATAFIGQDQTVNTRTSFPLVGGAALTINDYTGELWGIATAPVTLGIIETEL